MHVYIPYIHTYMQHTLCTVLLHATYIFVYTMCTQMCIHTYMHTYIHKDTQSPHHELLSAHTHTHTNTVQWKNEMVEWELL